MTETAAEYLVAPCANYDPKPLNVELRRVKIAARLSQETTAFAADIYLDGVRVGDVRNEGTGGAHRVHIRDPKVAQVIEAWALPQVPEDVRKWTPGTEWLIDHLLDQHLQSEADKRFAKKLAKVDKTEVEKASAKGARVARYRSGEAWIWFHYTNGDVHQLARANAHKEKRTVDELVVVS